MYWQVLVVRSYSQFQSLIKEEIVSVVDLHAVDALVDLAQPKTAIAAEVVAVLAMAIGAGRDGNTCIDIEALPKLPAVAGVSWPTSVAAWTSLLSSCADLVRVSSQPETSPRHPFVLDDTRLYITRSYEEERAVVNHLVRLHAGGQLTVVLGGPGTGKTTYISGELITMFSGEGADSIKLSLVAPTGKAARRMRQSLMRALSRSTAPEDVIKKILDAADSRTVHKLLGMSPRRAQRYKFNSDPKSRLKCNLLIVDEASMMSLSLMYHLLEALEDGAKVWLVGDPDQLASVDAGTVLGDISQVTVPVGSRFHSSFVPRTEQHRYPEDSRINQLVKCVRDAQTEKDVELFLKILSETSADVSWIDPKVHKEELNKLTQLVIDNANAVASLAEAGKPAEALAALASVQILCANREGAMGVAGWNRSIQRAVKGSASHPFYFGRPVMINKNDDSLQLANGDVGVVCNIGGIRKVAFEGLDKPVEIPVNSLPSVDTVHGLTIHKSQGSEYTHAVVVLPTQQSKILTRELLYTAISRPTERLTIVATADAIAYAINNPIRRSTGLVTALKSK
jgi:exodeoxyribonuclease V alpha subunit